MIRLSSKIRNILILLLLHVVCIPSLVMAATVSYTYDAVNRLVSEVYEDRSAIFYSYDEVGNRTSKIISGPLTITAIAGSGGTITPAGSIEVPYGSDQVYEIAAYDTGIIEDVLIDGISVGPITSYTFLGVTTAHYIEARFLDCGVSVTPATETFPQSGGTGNVAISMQHYCPWAATSNSPWITLTSEASGTGSGNLSYSVSESSNILQRTGTIRVAGHTVHVIQSAASSRIISDETFSAPDGTAIYNRPAANYNWGSGVAVQPDGSIVVVGTSADDMSSSILALRYNSDGSLDETFGTNGVTVYAEGKWNYGNAVAIQPDGKIVIVGANISDTDSSVLALRYNRDGTLDSSFGSNGAAAYSDGNWAFGNDVLIDPDGKILVLGTNYIYGAVDSAALLLRLNPDGSPDNTFGSGGVFSYSGSLGAEGLDLALQPDNRIVVSGMSRNDMSSYSLLMRFNADGTLDNTFGINGTVTYTDGSWDYGVAVGIQTDEKIVVAASSSYGTGHILLMRYDPQGNPDISFGTDGISGYINNAGPDVWPEAMALQPDGRIVVAGAVSNDLFLARFNTDGSLDRAFGINGTLAYNDTVDGYIGGYVLALQPDGKIVVAGERVEGALDSLFIMRFTDLRYSLSVTKKGSGHGTVMSYEDNPSIDCGTTCLASYPADTTVLLTAVPGEGSHFAGWSGGSCTGTQDCSLTMGADKSEAAQFDINSYIINSAAGVHGSINPSGAVAVTHGAGQTFNISADAGYEIADILVDGLSAGASGSYVFTDITAPHTISASFRAVSRDLAVSVLTDKGRLLAGIKVYAFKSSGAYTGTSLMTGAEGTALFKTDAFAQGAYKFRADYMGHQFWSDTVNLPGNGTLPIVIAEEQALVKLSPAVSGVKVYLFSGAGSYLGLNGTSDISGNVSFDLPAGKAFKFRADYLGNQYWSAVATLGSGGPNAIQINLGGGLLRLTIQKSAGSYISGLKTYLFSRSGAYLGISQTTDSGGAVIYNVSAGDFRIRADYMGYQFWTPDIKVSADTALSLEFPHKAVTFTLSETFMGVDTPLEGQTVYLFSAAGAYLNVSKVSDADGRVVIDLPQREYKVRADYFGKQYWSTGITWLDTDVNIPMAEADITVTGSGGVLTEVPVYVFSPAGTYLNYSGQTDDSGSIVFRIPEGSYMFRADYQAKQFWTPETAVAEDEIRPVAVSTGGGTFRFQVTDNAQAPLRGVKCYLFAEGGPYLNIFGITNEQGEAAFSLADGNYRIRVDYLGHQFWTDVLAVPQALDNTLIIDHQDVTFAVEGRMATETHPITGVKVYLFSPSGTYLGTSRVTDADGIVTFSLPERAYMARADYLGQQFWTEPVIWQDAVLEIPEGIARVHVSMNNSDIAGNTVYIYSSADHYLGINGRTAADGVADFRLPAGTYKFRTDYQGQKCWSGLIDVTAGQRRDLHIDPAICGP